MGFPELFEKTIGPVHFIPGIYPYRVSLLTPIYIYIYIYIRVNLLKKLLAQLISYLAFNPYGVSLLTPINFCVPRLIFGPQVAKYLAKNGVSRTF